MELRRIRNLENIKDKILIPLVIGVIGTILSGAIVKIGTVVFETKLDSTISKEFLNTYEKVYIEVLNNKCSVAGFKNNYEYTDKEKNEIMEPLKSISTTEFYNDIKNYIFKPETEYSRNTYVYTGMNLEYASHSDEGNTIDINEKGIIYRKNTDTGKTEEIKVQRRSFKVKRSLFGKNIKIKHATIG